MGEAATTGRGRAASIAALVRVPNLFTAPPDVILGAAVAAGTGAVVTPGPVAGLAAASVLLYAGGTALNDAFDAPEDASERPERPIPSGEVSRLTGFGLGSALLVLGVAAAAAASGVASGAVAAATAAGVLLYDGVAKGGPVGFLTMGAVRGLNVLLGLSVAGGVPSARSLVPPAVVAAYVAGVTFVAARETEGGDRFAVGVAATGTVGAALAVVLYHWVTGPPVAPAVPGGTAIAGIVLAIGFLAWTGPGLRAAFADPVPDAVGPAVGRCVLGIVVLDAAFAAATGVTWAVAVVAFLAPAVGLSRAFDVT